MNSDLPDKVSPKNSFSSSFWAFISILIIASLTVFLLRHKPLWYELEILAGEFIFILGSFYSYALYKGLSFENEPLFFNRKRLSYEEVTEWFNFANFDFFTSWAGEAVPILGHIVGFLIDLIVAFILSLVIGFFIWVGLDFIFTGLIFLVSILYYFFRRTHSIVFRHQVVCRGRISFALFYGFLYACFYTLLICLMVFLLRPITP